MLIKRYKNEKAWKLLNNCFLYCAMKTKPFLLLFFCAAIMSNGARAQRRNTKPKVLENVLYVVDYVPMVPHDERYMLSKVFYIDNKDIYSKEVIFDKKKIKYVGYEGVDTLIVITTNEYHNRPDDIKNIPNLFYNMELREDGKIYAKGSRNPYTGKFINYYYSGRTLAKGNVLNGLLNDTVTTYYEDGITKKQSAFLKKGKLEGTANEYFPNGSLRLTGKHSDSLKTGVWIEWYSTGKIKGRLFYEKGKKVIPHEDIQWTQLLDKAKAYLKDGDVGQARQCYENAITMRPDISDVYYAKGMLEARLNHFDSAIKYLDIAILLEPLYIDAINERIVARIKKYAMLNNNKKKKHYSDDEGYDTEMTKEEKDKLCDDITAISLMQQQDHSIILRFILPGLKESVIMANLMQQYCK